MSQLDEARQQDQPADHAVRGRIDWAVFVVILAVGCSLVWIYLWLWAAVRVVQAALS